MGPLHFPSDQPQLSHCAPQGRVRSAGDHLDATKYILVLFLLLIFLYKFLKENVWLDCFSSLMDLSVVPMIILCSGAHVVQVPGVACTPHAAMLF